MNRDWVEWHHGYDAPTSALSRRLEVVRRDLRRALGTSPTDPGGTRRLLSICAGDGRDVLPVIAEHDRRVRALLVELDPVLARRARETADDLGLPAVEVRVADAGQADTYLGVRPAHVLLACGVFGNIDDTDTRRTVAALPALLAPGGIVIWTRARGAGDTDLSLRVRALFAEHGFTELSFTSPHDARFRVGMHRLAGPVRHALAGRLFTFR
ncbi:class I SAM-dependent methyltransferase [Dactylosporangium aurantiacum]|uniref:Class I SAM-dependent methyltransferase n=1 Tax=Dactylosporangium aurantiacum TaxID=35754 RepID=A0A9Q9IJX6_9ACTN|nr:class I SAM-dependent methyltransferase [Dactylosporangium aurantiacum]MDG6105723.1 class I SAM-dependent methyltransferase [Dactylosporangium aurantiacum]UWZ56956.1 class I SAM-dependent methyltransferase [Dactylosporangium aurantiacum]